MDIRSYILRIWMKALCLRLWTGEVAIMYMEDFQMRAKTDRLPELKTWPWYVDDRIKRGIIKGYSDRAKALCDPMYLDDELNNIKEVFKENGYSEEEISEAMKERWREEWEENEEPTKGIVVFQNIPNTTPQFYYIARENRFRVANKSGAWVKDLRRKRRFL